MFGTPSSAPAFGTPSSTPAFGTQSSIPAFGTPSSTPAFGTPSPASAFGAPSSAPAFGTPSTPAFGATPSPFVQPQQSPFTPFSNPHPQPQPNLSFGFQTPSPSPFPNAQVTTQMAPVAPLSLSLPDRDVQAIVDAYKDEPGNPKYSFRHLLFSVTDPAARVKPVGASDIMWAEAMAKLEGMEALDRERLWPQLVQGFKDLSNRLKLQDEVIVSDTERLRKTQTNVKMLQSHFVAEILPWIQRMRQKEQELQRRLLRMMRIVEALEGKGFRVPLTTAESELGAKLTAIARQLRGPGAELSNRVHNLLAVSRLHVNNAGGGGGGALLLPGSTKIDEQSLAEMQDVLQKQTEAIARLGNVLKRDMRDVEIIMSEGTDMVEDVGRRAFLKT
ncbi:hypothetical protein J5N97_020583 [Dioscorea zingiberensis]|uniref:Nucleoporin Nup54 alpha-helical domain-containing protein n=1 Tax=Dioscorea zingiberensis TaxID=325984 RepID=A0A9D5CGP4_9LILI|nr:hypothetical protein J5N97_020583 [Dioscorea zingiberensis]